MTAGLVAQIGVARPSGFELDISLSIAGGTTVALLGPNGSGKSTTVDALAGLVPLDRGSIKLGDRVLDDPRLQLFEPPEGRRIGVVFQQYLLFEHLDVAENIAFGPVAAGRTRVSSSAIATEWMERLGLEDLATQRPAELSGGQSQRVALARALATEPALLLLDEPLAALDIETRSLLRRTLKQHLADYDGPRLLITHDPADAFLLADTIYILEDGRITQMGTPDEIRRAPATPYVAALAGLNLLSGHNDAGSLTLDDHEHVLASADTATLGDVLITIRPNAIALHAEQPHGSPRNSWLTEIDTLESLGDITRVILAAPLPLSVDITPNAASAMRLESGSPIWASVKATEIHLNPS